MSKNKTVNEICILSYSNVFKMSFYSFELCGSVPLKKNKKRNSTDREKRISSIIIQKRPKIPCLLNNKKELGSIGGVLQATSAKPVCPHGYNYIFQELILKSLPKRHPCRWIFDLGSRLQTSEKHFKALITRHHPKCGNASWHLRINHPQPPVSKNGSRAPDLLDATWT